MAGSTMNVVLEKSGDSLVMTVPAEFRRALELTEGSELTIALDGRRLILEPAGRARTRYTLAELLAEEADAGIDPQAELDRDWLDAPPVGREIW